MAQTEQSTRPMLRLLDGLFHPLLRFWGIVILGGLAVGKNVAEAPVP